ncbi:hypothetical protein [Azospirillum argentinense]
MFEYLNIRTSRLSHNNPPKPCAFTKKFENTMKNIYDFIDNASYDLKIPEKDMLFLPEMV